jgi:hypothetical protein
MHHSIHRLGTSRFNAPRCLKPPEDLALTPATVHEANCSARYALGWSSTLSFACPVLHCERRPTHCFKSTAAQGDGYSGTSGLVLGLSSITSIRGELVSLLRRYFNTLYPLAFTLLRNLVQSYPGCTLIPSRRIPPVQADLLTYLCHFSARSRCSRPPWTCEIDLDRLPQLPSNITRFRPPLPAPGLCSAQPFISERRSFAVGSTQILLDVPRAPTTR